MQQRRSSRPVATALARAVIVAGALFAGLACDDDSAGPADLSAAGSDLARVADLASATVDGGLPAGCTTAGGGDACDPSTQYCYQCICGAPVHRGGAWSNGAESCMALPPACAATPTCACVLANAPRPGCTCTMVGTQVLLSCVGP